MVANTRFVKLGVTSCVLIAFMYLYRQSYDVEIRVGIDGTELQVQETYNLKNPTFHHSDASTSAFPVSSDVSPTEAVWQRKEAPVQSSSSAHPKIPSGVNKLIPTQVGI